MTTTSKRTNPTATRMTVPKTYKLYIGGKFPRSESGRTVDVLDSSGEHLANAARASRKDTREAVVAARKAAGSWGSATAYLRGQILYRIAEMLDARREQFIAELMSTGGTRRAAESEVDEAVATWVHYAGWADKYAQVVGSANPVAAPYFNFSLPEPVGVVAIIAPQTPGLALLGLARTIAPAIVAGNTTVVVAHERNPLAAISFAEVLASSDVPGGVVNILTGLVSELAPILAGHMDVNAIDLTGVAADGIGTYEELAIENLKRIVRPENDGTGVALQRRRGSSGTRTIDAITRLTELKTVWHPIGV
jgi:acyl-CoA reductase-like NAD-dependent aldehyde dehydrogenase